jgi:hypothetical protein
MRRDYLIAILLALSAVPLGAAMMAAPDYLHLTGYSVALTFWGGIALASALLLFAAFVALRGGKDHENPSVSPHSHAPRDAPLIDAIWRAHLGRWGDRVDYGTEWEAKAPFYKTVAAVRQMARDGKLPVWGTRRERGAPFEPIPLSFWSTHDIEAGYVIMPLVKDTWVYVTEPTKIGQVRNAKTFDWENFMTSREVVERLWPEGTG